jgi:nicotinamidase-related amidase
MGERTLRLQPRYYNLFTDPGVPMTEANCRYATLDWRVSLRETALVCLDLWDRDTHSDLREADDRMTRQRIVPVVNACRETGLQIIHAPTPPIARRHPNCVRLVGDDEHRQPPWPNSPTWPPEAFRKKAGPFAGYARPEDSRRVKAWADLEVAEFHEMVQPVGDEAVIRTGEELHRLCAARQILHLVYVGVHTPGCMTGRSYGLTQMLRRGYHVILLRDCTNGMETHETREDATCMRGAIAFLEQTGVYTLTSDELIAALSTSGA